MLYTEGADPGVDRPKRGNRSAVGAAPPGAAALVQLKPEIIEKLEATVQDGLEGADELLESIRKQINTRVSAFSRIGRIEIQPEPFEKTPSQKIKRFLYPRKSSADGEQERKPQD